MRHTLTSLLAAVAAVLAGARSFAAIGEWVANAPPQVPGPLGIRRDLLTARFRPPDESTIRRVLEKNRRWRVRRREGILAGTWRAAAPSACQRASDGSHVLRGRATAARRCALMHAGRTCSSEHRSPNSVTIDSNAIQPEWSRLTAVI